MPAWGLSSCGSYPQGCEATAAKEPSRSQKRRVYRRDLQVACGDENWVVEIDGIGRIWDRVVPFASWRLLFFAGAANDDPFERGLFNVLATLLEPLKILAEED